VCNVGKKFVLVLSHSIQTKNNTKNSTWNHAMIVEIRTSGLIASLSPTCLFRMGASQRFEASGDAATPARMSIDCTDFAAATHTAQCWVKMYIPVKQIFQLISNNTLHWFPHRFESCRSKDAGVNCMWIATACLYLLKLHHFDHKHVTKHWRPWISCSFSSWVFSWLFSSLPCVDMLPLVCYSIASDGK